MSNPKPTRRSLFAAAAAPLLTRTNPNDIRILDATAEEEYYSYRTPYMFGGHVVDQVTLVNVNVEVANRAGKRARGFGAMPMGNVWSWPSRRVDPDLTLDAMSALSAGICRITADCKEYGHPIELNRLLEPEWLRAAQRLNYAEPIPKLCVLVTASPFDAALHDAYGKLHGLSAYQTYGREFLAEDLARYLNADFKGLYLDQFVNPKPAPRLAVFHTVGASDPLFPNQIQFQPRDGLPVTLGEWIVRDGLTHFKIKLNGGDPAGDRDRILAVHAVAGAVRGARYSLDFNERCPSASALVDILNEVRAAAPECFERLVYVEQPTKRDLAADRQNVMHDAAKLCPVVIDESLTGLDMLLLAREMGYTGIALKACKGQSQAMLMAAAGQHYKMFLTVQDLTCPGAALIHSAGIAAHVPGVAGIEANARQYVPAANRGWAARFPGIFTIRGGVMDTSSLTGPGLGAV